MANNGLRLLSRLFFDTQLTKVTTLYCSRILLLHAHYQWVPCTSDQLACRLSAPASHGVACLEFAICREQLVAAILECSTAALQASSAPATMYAEHTALSMPAELASTYVNLGYDFDAGYRTKASSTT